MSASPIELIKHFLCHSPALPPHSPAPPHFPAPPSRPCPPPSLPCSPLMPLPSPLTSLPSPVTPLSSLPPSLWQIILIIYSLHNYLFCAYIVIAIFVMLSSKEAITVEPPNNKHVWDPLFSDHFVFC